MKKMRVLMQAMSVSMIMTLQSCGADVYAAVAAAVADQAAGPSMGRMAMFFAIGLVGMVAHYVNRWSRGEFDGNLFDYMVHKQPRHTVSAIMTLGTAAGVAFAANQLDAMPLGAFAMSAFGVGYTCDSTVNSGGKNESEPASA